MVKAPLILTTKNIPANVLAVDETRGIADAIVNVFGIIDLGRDIVHPGAFTKTIAQRAGRIRVLDAHNTGTVRSVIGRPLAIREVGRNELPASVLQEFPEATGGLFTTTQYALNTEAGAEIFERIKSGIVNEYSIGFDIINADNSSMVVDDEEMVVRNLRELRLWEYSVVVFGMNQATTTVQASLIGNPNKPASFISLRETEDVLLVEFPGEQPKTINPTREAIVLDHQGVVVTVCETDDEICYNGFTFDSVVWDKNEAINWTFENKDLDLRIAPPQDAPIQLDDKALTPFQDLPLSTRSRRWAASAARRRISNWAETADGDIDFSKFRRAFIWFDAENRDNVTAYKFPIADLLDGTLTVIPRAIFAAAAVIQGGRGGADIPDADEPRVKNHLARYYAKMRREFDDDTIIPPWQQRASGDDSEDKEMTPDGPVQRMGDVLTGNIHQVFSMIADSWLIAGFLNEDERKGLSSAIGAALDMFKQEAPEQVLLRALPGKIHFSSQPEETQSTDEAEINAQVESRQEPSLPINGAIKDRLLQLQQAYLEDELGG